MKMDKLNTGAENDGSQTAGCRPTKRTRSYILRYGHLRARKTIEITTQGEREETLTEHQVIPPQRDTTNTRVSLTWGKCLKATNFFRRSFCRLN